MRWPFVRRHIALRRPHGLVEGRVAHPGLEHAVIEIKSVHLGAHDVPVDLLCDRPPARVDGMQARQVIPEFFVSRGKPRSRVIGRTVKHWRPLEITPFGKQGQQVLVTAGRKTVSGSART